MEHQDDLLASLAEQLKDRKSNINPNFMGQHSTDMRPEVLAFPPLHGLPGGETALGARSASLAIDQQAQLLQASARLEERAHQTNFPPQIQDIRQLSYIGRRPSIFSCGLLEPTPLPTPAGVDRPMLALPGPHAHANHFAATGSPKGLFDVLRAHASDPGVSNLDSKQHDAARRAETLTPFTHSILGKRRRSLTSSNSSSAPSVLVDSVPVSHLLFDTCNATFRPADELDAAATASQLLLLTGEMGQLPAMPRTANNMTASTTFDPFGPMPVEAKQQEATDAPLQEPMSLLNLKIPGREDWITQLRRARGPSPEVAEETTLGADGQLGDESMRRAETDSSASQATTVEAPVVPVAQSQLAFASVFPEGTRAVANDFDAKVAARFDDSSSKASAATADDQSMARLQNLMRRSEETQQALQEWDKLQGLPKSHCSTMVKTSRSRKQLQEGKILPKWDGTPLIGEEPPVKPRRKAAKKQSTDAEAAVPKANESTDTTK